MTENQALPSVKIEIGGQEYTLLYTLYAFAKLQKIGNINALKGDVDFGNPEHVLYFLWAGLISHHPELDGELIEGRPDKALSETLRKLGTYLTIEKLQELGAAVRLAFQNATQTSESKRNEAKASKQKKQ